MDCRGKSYMITGGNSGIGKCIALDIAKRGGTVHLVCRNAKSAEEAKNEIIKDFTNTSNPDDWGMYNENLPIEFFPL